MYPKLDQLLKLRRRENVPPHDFPLDLRDCLFELLHACLVLLVVINQVLLVSLRLQML